MHSPFGAQVHAPWALALSARLAERYGMDAQVMHADDGIVLRLPDADMMGLDLLDFDPAQDPAQESGQGAAAPLAPANTAFGSDQPPVGAADVAFDKDEIAQIVTDQVGGSALFASRFRECAARALLLPRRSPGKRTPLWQQRQRAAQLLQVASEFGSFPIVLEAVRECLQDVFDVPGLTEVMGDLEARRIRLVEVTTQEPSPSPAPSSSATSPSSCTRATRRSPNGAPPRSPWTPGSSPNCWAGRSCANCSTPMC